MQTLETVMREWLLSFDSSLHTILSTTPVKDFIAKNLNSAVAFAKDWCRKVPVEPSPTRANIRKELRYLLSPEGQSWCSECGDRLTEENRWSEYTCKKCAKELGLDSEPDIALNDCLKAIDNGNCARDCTTCPIWKRFKVPEEDQERAMKEHRFGAGADEDPHPLHVQDTV